MPLALIRHGLGLGRAPRPHFGAPRALRPSYDVVVIGGGGHGLATAHYLARRHGVTNVAVLEKAHIGGGNTARNTAVIRSNYLTEEGVRFYRESARMFRELSGELGYNTMFSGRGQLTLAHTDATVRSFRWRAEVNRHLGVRSELVGADRIRELVPSLSLSEKARYPVLAGLWHADGATARHDAVAWGYAKSAAEAGVEIHQHTEVTGLRIEGGALKAVRTNRGEVACGCAVQAVAGHSSLLAALAGFRLPVVSYPLQAMVTQPLKPFLDPHVSSAQLHCYVHQTARGEVVIGGGSDPYPLYSTRATLGLKEGLAAAAVEMFPFLAEARILRQWAGITDMTPDYSPIMGKSPVDNYHLDAGWGTWGFKATPVCGKTMAELVATGRTPALIRPFALARFGELRQVNERGATAASH